MPIMKIKDHWQPLWRRNANIPEADLSERFIYVYHGTVWSLHEVPQRWKWQSLNILVVVYRDFTGTHPSNQRGRLNATPDIRTRHDANTPRCLSCPKPTYMCTLNSCKEEFQLCLAPTTPSEEFLSIKLSKKRWTRTHIRQGDQGVVWSHSLWENTNWPPSIGSCTWPCTWECWGTW